MATTKRSKPNPSTNPIALQHDPVNPTPVDFEPAALALIALCFAGDLEGATAAVQGGTQCWVQDSEGSTALHAAAASGNTELVTFLLRKGNAVWNLTDNLGYTAGDIAYSLNDGKTYEVLLAEGVRSEMLAAVMRQFMPAATEDSDEVGEEEEEDIIEVDGEELEEPVKRKKSTAGDNKTFLQSSLKFVTDESGQDICLDREGNGVMMGWEKGIMRETARLLCEEFEGRKSGELGEETLSVMNVGFGLGIIDTFLQEYRPTDHLIIEPHPDVLAHAKSKGWYEIPGVRFYEGTWKQYLADLEDEKEPYEAFDVVYFDTYSEHYVDLHAFFDCLPNLLLSPSSKFSFFHGLGATSRSFYDVYTEVSTLHLQEVGLATSWSEIEVGEEVVGMAGSRWADTTGSYWKGEVGACRIPICRMGA